MKISLLATLLTILVSNVFAQAQQSITGQLSSADSGEALSYATIILISSADSTAISYTVTNDSGVFSLKGHKQGSYIINASLTGYIEKDFNVSLTGSAQDLGTLTLETNALSIDEVEIKSNQSVVKYGVDRKIVYASQFSTATAAIDLLQSIPSLEVDLNDNITYRGDGGLRVMINGVFVDNGEAKLRQIPANKILRVELITNPSAKYSAEGTAGIINVVLKKNRLEGLTISSELKYSTRGNQAIELSIDQKSEKFGWYFNSSLSRTVWQDQDISTIQESIIGDSTLLVNSAYNNNGGGEFMYLDLGFNYDISERDYIDFSINLEPIGTLNYQNKYGSYNEKLFVGSGQVSDQSFIMNSGRDQTYQYLGATLNYKHAFNEQRDHNLSITLDYFTYLKPFVELTKEQQIYSSHTDVVGLHSTEDNEQLFSAIIDYEAPLGKNLMLESGIDYTSDVIPTITAISGMFDSKDELIPFENTPKGQEAYYAQNILSSYFTLKYKIKKFEFLAGLRGEYTYRRADLSYTDTKGEQIEVPYNNDFFDLFPTAHAVMNISESEQIAANYSRRINRARYYQFIPLVSYYDTYAYYNGNAGLLPTFSDSYEIGYSKSWDRDYIAVDIFSRQSKNVIQDYSRLASTDEFRITPENVGDSFSLGIEVAGGADIRKWWNINSSISLYNYKLNIDIDEKNSTESLFRSSFRVANSFTLPANFKFSFVGQYYSPSITAQSRTSDYFNFDASLSKAIFNNKLTMSVIGSNIFDTVNFNTISSGEGFSTDSSYTTEPFATFSIAYRWQKQ